MLNVAPSFQNHTPVTEPYKVGDKMYIDLRHPNTGNVRKARWYEDAEWKKLYAKKVAGTPASAGETQSNTAVGEGWRKSPKEVLGFDKGYITLLHGENDTNVNWLKSSIARYAVTWGWYIISTDTIPVDVPASLKQVRLYWNDIGNEDGTIKPETQVKAYVNKLLYGEGNENISFPGEVGERIQAEVTVKSATVEPGNYGVATTHVMEDSEGNTFIWKTSSKNWTVGEHKVIKGTVKENKFTKSGPKTYLTRCQEVKA